MNEFMAALFIAGVFAYFKLGRAEDPDFTVKVMVVRTLWPGATAAEVAPLLAAADRVAAMLTGLVRRLS